MDLTPSQWIEQCAARPGERWRTVPVAKPKVAAVEVWRDEVLRKLSPDDAAAGSLSPVGDQ